MRRRRLLPCLTLAVLSGLAACTTSVAAEHPLPAPQVDVPRPATPSGDRTAVFAGGCFWGMQAVFEHVRGVRHVWAGYAGGSAATANYADVSSGGTGHAESVEIRFDPSVVSYGQLLQVYFAVAHDPTELNRQGPDRGTQYRSEIFTTSATQQHVAQAYIAQLGAARAFDAPIVTRVAPLRGFYMGESWHQDYVRNHPDNLYVVINDAPKLRQLQRRFPALYQPAPTLVAVQLH